MWRRWRWWVCHGNIQRDGRQSSNDFGGSRFHWRNRDIDYHPGYWSAAGTSYFHDGWRWSIESVHTSQWSGFVLCDSSVAKRWLGDCSVWIEFAARIRNAPAWPIVEHRHDPGAWRFTVFERGLCTRRKWRRVVWWQWRLRRTDCCTMGGRGASLERRFQFHQSRCRCSRLCGHMCIKRVASLHEHSMSG